MLPHQVSTTLRVWPMYPGVSYLPCPPQAATDAMVLGGVYNASSLLSQNSAHIIDEHAYHSMT